MDGWLSDWHAGVTVIGLYLVCPQAAFSQALAQVCRLAAASTSLQGVIWTGRAILQGSGTCPEPAS